MKVTDENTVTRSGVGSGSVSQKYGFQDPGLYQYVTNPQQCLEYGRTWSMSHIVDCVPFPVKISVYKQIYEPDPPFMHLTDFC